MTLRHLEIFRTVCAEKSITKAAEKLNMTQPAVSIAIKEMEVFYDTKLFDRVNRRIYLTEAGGKLLEYADTISGQFKESVKVLRDKSNFKHCTIGVNVSIAETILPDIVKKVNDKLSDIHMNIVIGNSHEIAEKLSDNKIDFALMDINDSRHTYKSELLFEDKMLAFCLKSVCGKGKITLRELAEHNLLLREEGSGSRECVKEAFAAKKIREKPFVESTSTMSLIELMKCGLGIAMLPKYMTNLVKNDDINVMEISDANLKRCYYMHYNERKNMTMAAMSVMEIIRKL